MTKRRIRKRFTKRLDKYSRKIERLDVNGSTADFALESSHNFEMFCLEVVGDLVIEVDRLQKRVERLEKR